MNITIVFNLKSGKEALRSIVNNRILYYTETKKDALIYHIDNVNVDSYIINPAGMSSTQIKSMIEQIKYLNALITILVLDAEYELSGLFTNEKNVVLVKSNNEIPSYLNKISSISRNSNRIHWPLHVEYWKPDNKKETLKRANVLSISSSGCFIGASDPVPFKKEEPVAMVFSFKSFDFYSDGYVVRIDNSNTSTMGIAVAFKEVSPQTQFCIRSIIDEKILSDIMKSIK